MNIRQALSKRMVMAFNADNWLVFKSVVAVVEETNLPVILEASEGEMKFWGMENFFAAVNFQKSRGLPLFINFDHGKNIGEIKKAIDLGFDMVHIDASSLPWQANIRLTRQVVDWGRKKGVLVEAEPQGDLTDPEKVREFVEKTAVDLVAVFVGNKHGFNPKEKENIDIGLLKKIKAKAGLARLTLHGGSGVNRRQLSWAIKEKLLVKMNVNSRLRFIYRRAFIDSFKSNPSLRFYEIARPVMNDLKKEIRAMVLATIEKDHVFQKK